MRRFDEKFGSDFLESVSTGPGVYLFKDGGDVVIYVGKAKSLRRRLASYRRATKRRVHRKMRVLVREASRVEVRYVDSEEQALVLENALIRELQPRFNVDGAFSFLYPAIGLLHTPARTLLCFTTATDAWSTHGFRWFGVFRSRPRAKSAFDTLIELLSIVGHRERTSTLGPRPDARGSRLAGIRQLDAAWVASLEDWLAGGSDAALSTLARTLLEKPRARRDAKSIGASLRDLRAFFESDLRPLKEALERSGRPGTFVAQAERDVLFIRARPTSAR